MRIIAHVDMDAFFAAVEERYNPKLRGLPIVVGADPKQGKGRGVVATANYKAREFGIHSALPISRAWKLAEAARRRGEPATIFLRGNHELYQEVSSRIMQILRRGADTFEEASIDEAYIDISSLGSFEAAEKHARSLKSEISDKEGLTCSIGIGPNKLIAKIASGHQKPDGLTVIRPERVQEFLDPLPVRTIPGIGPKGEAFLREQNILTIKDLRRLSEPELVHWFGKWGQSLHEKARGIDDSPVSSEWVRKSLGEQETFERDTLDASFLTAALYGMAESTLARLREEGFRSFRTVTLTVRFSDFETKSRSRTLKNPVSAGNGEAALTLLKQEALKLFVPFLDRRENPRRKPIRLIGLRLEKLS